MMHIRLKLSDIYPFIGVVSSKGCVCSFEDEKEDFTDLSRLLVMQGRFLVTSL